MKQEQKFFAVLTLLLATALSMSAGDGVTAINQATSEINRYFEAAAKLMLGIGAIAGLIGGIMVYSKFSSGDPEGGKRIGKWVGGAIFLCLVPTILKAFFF